ncbi:MetQ/NlpA family ABC transporter substrate-binding protein [Herbaspirillum sp. RTI4]|uniref:MetQ/NlpA family ABC transporter substrate-binding protein n=1 Tax=Herbaspirillum sp. RTI4 TaxID=3048640 RepID=UPI002AB4A44F|nr:MetQ/NlpA family ABC transporter substrate-binding protein [Herbaspirillum sp. RTI4]MDY7578460.1 MetQ/NlpA family ABC transporter substrate-binding protein [Herbaspirillum sp. RTI4]MEA9981511.1 MetQ/NlpA family ABC transporter substrate-binding protein [Herbaspirillum sp. RTI4]
MQLNKKINTTLRILLQSAGALLAATTLSSALAAPLKIGVTPGAYADSVHVAAAEAKKQGLDVQVVEFSDWTTPNVALESKDLDANYFQHKPFLDNAIKDRGYHFAYIATGVLANIGLYSTKHKSFAEIPVGGRVSIANDPVNQGRGLLLLQKAGLIKLRDGASFKSTLADIIDNPKKLKFTEVEGPQLVRTLNDVDLAQGYPHFIVAAGTIDPNSALLLSGIDDKQFAVGFVSRQDNATDPRLKKFIEIYQQSQGVRAQLKKSFGNSDRLYTLAWLAH